MVKKICRLHSLLKSWLCLALYCFNHFVVMSKNLQTTRTACVDLSTQVLADGSFDMFGASLLRFFRLIRDLSTACFGIFTAKCLQFDFGFWGLSAFMVNVQLIIVYYVIYAFASIQICTHALVANWVQEVSFITPFIPFFRIFSIPYNFACQKQKRWPSWNWCWHQFCLMDER